jgi:hypothetical protein
MSNRNYVDIMQVCLNGHVINYRFVEKPEDNKDFCNRCGKKTITNCPNPKCDKPMPSSPSSLFGISSAPDFCQHCGEQFPWAREAEAKRLKEEAEKPIEALQKVFSRFHLIVRKLRNNRYSNRGNT